MIQSPPPKRWYIDSKTGTFGEATDLIFVQVEPPENFSDWSDSERIKWAEAHEEPPF